MKPATLIALATIALAFVPLKVVSYNWDGEDCFISYRVAENFVAGKGLVFNDGQRVEAYSNFLWTAMLGACAAMGLPTPLMGKVLSLLSVVATIFLLGFARPRNDGEDDGGALVLLAPAIYLLHPMVHYQCDRGLETCFYAFLLVLSCFCWLRRQPLATSLALTAVALTRPEGFGFFGVVILLTAFEQWRRRRAGVSDGAANAQFWAWLVAPFAILFGAYIGWRVAYYGYPLPSTVYAKTSAGNFLRAPAFHDILQFLISWSYLPLWALLALAARVGRERRRYLNALCAFAGGVFVYILAVGHVIAEPFRHFVPAIPFIALLLQEVAIQWRLSVCARQQPQAMSATWGRWSLALVVALPIGLTFYTSDIRDSPKARLHARLAQFARHPAFAARWRWFVSEPIRLDAEAGRWLAQRYPPETLTVAGQMGQLGYYSRLRMIDALGLADARVAREGFSLDYALTRDPDLWVMLYYERALTDNERAQLEQDARWAQTAALARERGLSFSAVKVWPAPGEFQGVDDPRFTERYVARYELRTRSPYDGPTAHYRVFERRAPGQTPETETLVIGPPREEYEACYRLGP